jgi:hypothetical protein
MLLWGEVSDVSLSGKIKQIIGGIRRMANVIFASAAVVQAVNFGDVVKVQRDGETRAYVVAVAPCTKKSKAILVNLATGDIRGTGKKAICTEDYGFVIATTDLDTLKAYTKADDIEVLAGATLAIS